MDMKQVTPKQVGKLRTTSMAPGQLLQARTCLVTGIPGVGKTSLVRTFAGQMTKKDDGTPDWSRALLIAADQGYASIDDLTGLQVIRLFKDMAPAEVLKTLQDGAAKDFDLIMVDGLDKISQEVLAHFEALDAKKAKPDARSMWGDFGKAMRNWITKMAELDGPKLTVFISHVSEDAESDTRYGPAFAGGKVKTELVGYFDYAFFMKMHRLDPAKKPERVFLTSREQFPQYEVKARVSPSRTLPPVMPADLGLLWEYLFKPL